jgi:hypothetical protein
MDVEDRGQTLGTRHQAPDTPRFGAWVLGFDHFDRVISCNKEFTMNYIPHELAIGGVYFPPLLIAGILGVLAAMLTAMLLNRYRPSRFLYNPPLIFLALAIIYTGLIGTFLIPV